MIAGKLRTSGRRLSGWSPASVATTLAASCSADQVIDMALAAPAPNAARPAPGSAGEVAAGGMGWERVWGGASAAPGKIGVLAMPER